MTIKINLSDEEISSLKDIMKHHDNWRARERAQMLLLLSKGEKSSTIIGEVNVCISTLYSTIREWNKEKIASLFDKPRSGAPHKLSAVERENIIRDAQATPMTGPELLEQHSARGGTPIHPNTLRKELQKAKLVFKRTRHAVKKKKSF